MPNPYAKVRRNIMLDPELDEWVLKETQRRSRKERRVVGRSELVREALLVLRDLPSLKEQRGG